MASLTLSTDITEEETEERKEEVEEDDPAGWEVNGKDAMLGGRRTGPPTAIDITMCLVSTVHKTRALMSCSNRIINLVRIVYNMGPS
jgi:hypothetical protein